MPDRADIRAWCEASAFVCRDGEDDATLHVRLAADPDAEVTLTVPAGDAEALRLVDEAPLAAATELSAERLADVVEGVVLGRSAMVDARVTDRGDAAEVMVVVYPDAISRHHVLAALYEIEKVRLLLAREVETAVAAERAVASLEALATAADPKGGKGKKKRRR